MVKNKTNNFVSDKAGSLNQIGKTSVFSMGNRMESVILCINPKTDYVSKEERAKNANLAESCLNELGFETVYKFNMGLGLAAANMQIKYNLHKKPYTITRAKTQEIKSLQEVIKSAGVNVKIEREFVIAKGKSVIEHVPMAEFKKAISTYLNQHQK